MTLPLFLVPMKESVKIVNCDKDYVKLVRDDATELIPEIDSYFNVISTVLEKIDSI